MNNIPEEIKEKFLNSRDIGEYLLLAYYNYDKNHYSFIYEKNDTPFIVTYDTKTNKVESAQIPYTLPATMQRLSCLEKENEKLNKELKNCVKSLAGDAHSDHACTQ